MACETQETLLRQKLADRRALSNSLADRIAWRVSLAIGEDGGIGVSALETLVELIERWEAVQKETALILAAMESPGSLGAKLLASGGVAGA